MFGVRGDTPENKCGGSMNELLDLIPFLILAYAPVTFPIILVLTIMFIVTFFKYLFKLTVDIFRIPTMKRR